ncbi:MAG: BMP family protein [Cyanobacteria bacterium J06629_18]
MSINLNRRKFIGYCTAVFSSSLLLKACSNNQPSSTTDSNEGFKIAIALPGAITDKTWNQSGYEGIQLARRELNAETAFLEQVPQAEQTEVLTDFARKNYNLIFAHGGQFDAAIQQVAPQFPNTFFVGVNGAVKGDNIAALRINHQQASYLCGIVAASMTKSNQLAYIAGQKFAATEEELKGFESGAKSIKPEIKVTSTFTGDWNDASKAKEATLALISAGNDVVYQWLDNASPAVLQTAAEKNIYAFGNTKDQLEIAPKAVLTSAVKRMDLAIAYIAELAKNKQLKGDIYKIGLEKSDILILGKFGEMVPEDVQKKVMDVKQGIVEDKIQVS